MNRLIDANKLLNKIDAYMCGSQDVMFVKELIKEQPTAFNVDKVVEQLENIKFRNFLTIANTGDEKLDFTYSKVANILDKAIDIIKAGGIDE